MIRREGGFNEPAAGIIYLFPPYKMQTRPLYPTQTESKLTQKQNCLLRVPGANNPRFRGGMTQVHADGPRWCLNHSRFHGRKFKPDQNKHTKNACCFGFRVSIIPDIERKCVSKRRPGRVGQPVSWAQNSNRIKINTTKPPALGVGCQSPPI